MDEQNNQIEELARKKEAQDAARAQAIEDAKKVNLYSTKEFEEKGEEFNLDAFNEDFNTKNAPIITTIPEKVKYDIDDDILLE